MPTYDPVAKLKAKDLARRLTDHAREVPAGDPLAGVRETGQTAADDRAELEVVRRILREADRRVEEVSGNGFYCTLVFLTQAQRDVFLAATAWPVVEDGRYVDGLTAAAAMGVDLPVARPTAIRPTGPDRKATAGGIIPDYPVQE